MSIISNKPTNYINESDRPAGGNYERTLGTNGIESPIVYAINEPSRFDHNKKKMVKLNFNMATSFGRLHIIFPGEDRPPHIDLCKGTLRDEMANFRSCDRLLLAGDMDLVVFAAVLAAKATGGKLVLLKWHSRDRRYCEISAPEGLFK